MPRLAIRTVDVVPLADDEVGLEATAVLEEDLTLALEKHPLAKFQALQCQRCGLVRLVEAVDDGKRVILDILDTEDLLDLMCCVLLRQELPQSLLAVGTGARLTMREKKCKAVDTKLDSRFDEGFQDRAPVRVRGASPVDRISLIAPAADQGLTVHVPL